TSQPPSSNSPHRAWASTRPSTSGGIWWPWTFPSTSPTSSKKSGTRPAQKAAPRVAPRTCSPCSRNAASTSPTRPATASTAATTPTRSAAGSGGPSPHRRPRPSSTRTSERSPERAALPWAGPPRGSGVPQLRRRLVLRRRDRAGVRGRAEGEGVDAGLVDDRGGRLRRGRHDRGLGVAAAAVAEGDDAAVGRGELVGADAERLAEGAADRGEETAGDAGRGGRLGHRGLRAERLLPAVGGGVQAVAGQDPGTAHAQLVGDRRDGTPGGGRGQFGGGAAGDLGVLGVD